MNSFTTGETTVADNTGTPSRTDHDHDVARVVLDERRLAVLGRTALLDTPPEAPFDRIARLAARMLGAPISTVTLIDSERQFYKACVGLPEPIRSVRETSLDLSFCKHTVALGTPLVIPDTLADARMATMASVVDLGVRAYAGVPLIVDGAAIGTLCVMDLGPRAWTDEDVATLVDLAASVMTEIALRITVRELERTSAEARALRESAEHANRAKSEFLAMMSHDLRTPLNAIGGYRQLLELGVHGPLSEGQRETLARIKRAQDHLLYLIDQVLHYSRAEAGELSLKLRDTPVDDFLRGLEPLIRPQLDAKELTYEYHPGASAVAMRVDREMLTRIALNLLTNAVKFTPAGGRVSLRWKADDQCVYIGVSDTGIGIPAERQDAVFQPFVQVPGQKKMNPNGIGLGLAIGLRLAEAMNGNLTVTSESGRGATFELSVPRGADEGGRA